jgi:hypothetical protein
MKSFMPPRIAGLWADLTLVATLVRRSVQGGLEAERIRGGMLCRQLRRPKAFGLPRPHRYMPRCSPAASKMSMPLASRAGREAAPAATVHRTSLADGLLSKRQVNKSLADRAWGHCGQPCHGLRGVPARGAAAG